MIFCTKPVVSSSLSPPQSGDSPRLAGKAFLSYLFKIILFSMHKTIIFKVYGAIAFPEGKVGGADVLGVQTFFLDRPHFVGNKPKLILYCIGLMPPKDILIRSSLYQ